MMIGTDAMPVHIKEVAWKKGGYSIRGLMPGTRYRIEIAAVIHNNVSQNLINRLKSKIPGPR